MNTYAQADASLHRPNWAVRAEAWLDARGRPAWFAAALLGFVLFWPLGLAVLAYMYWRKKMINLDAPLIRRARQAAAGGTGNRAFDAYKAETLRRLEDEQAAFETFLQRLREARDKSEFDQFMEERKSSPAAPAVPQD